MKTKQLRKSEIRQLNEHLRHYNTTYAVDKHASATWVKGEMEAVVVDNTPIAFYHEGQLVPSLHLCLKEDVLKKVVVDMGAVRFVVKGADIMRPGIREIDETISAAEYVVVVDHDNGKPLAVARAIYGGEEMQQMEEGKVLENLHYVGDWLWNLQL